MYTCICTGACAQVYNHRTRDASIGRNICIYAYVLYCHIGLGLTQYNTCAYMHIFLPMLGLTPNLLYNSLPCDGRS